MTVLVLSAVDDDTTTRVCQELDHFGRDHIRLDLGDFPEALSVTMAGPESGWSGHISGADRSVRLRDIAGVYYRRPSSFQFSDDWPVRQRTFAVAESRQCWGGLLSCLRGPFVNRPSRAAEAELKPLQLHVAATLGLPVPRTLITSDGDEARAFVGALGRVLYKPLSALFLRDDDGVHPTKLVYATLVSVEDLDDDAIAWSPCQFQQFIPKHYDVRLTVVGGACYAVAIHAGSLRSYVDWRADYVRHEALIPLVEVNVFYSTGDLSQQVA